MNHYSIDIHKGHMSWKYRGYCNNSESLEKALVKAVEAIRRAPYDEWINIPAGFIVALLDTISYTGNKGV